MHKFLLLFSVISFVISFAAFFYALLCRYNIKRAALAQNSAKDDDFLEFPDMHKIDKKQARHYQIAIRFWGVSIIACIAAGLGVYFYK